MAEIESVARRWGNSLGLTIPKEVVELEGITENETLVITIQRKHTAREFFGLFMGWKKPTSEIKKEMKKGWQ